MKKSKFLQCPVAPHAKPMEGNECPLHIKHPPTEEEFALGCGGWPNFLRHMYNLLHDHDVHIK